MSPERWRRIDEILQRTLTLAEAERDAVLREACAEDPELRREVESLLGAHEHAEGFLEDRAIDHVLGTEAVPAAGPEAGSRIGPYRLLHELGRGGMSTVHLAQRADDTFQQRVAVKLLKRGLDTDSVLRRFRGERQILASLDHPNLANLYDGGTTADGRPYFVMEPIDGERIDEHCEHRRLSTAARLGLFRQVCAAVHYAHQNLVVHRDIKPSNILVTPEGVPKLLDFGIAKLLDPDSFPETVEATRTGLRPMTPRYASPEQLRGERITTASDVYSLGVLLYKLLTGSLPGEAPAAGAGRLTGDLERIVHMALRDEPERRYASAEQLSEDLRRYLAGLPVRAQRDTLRYRAGKFLRRHRIAVAVAAAFVLLVAGFIAALARQVEKTTGQRDRAELERDKAEQVSALLFDLFGSFDPSRTHGESVTAREILDHGMAKVERQLAGQPEVQAAAFDTIGKVYEKLGLYGRALPPLERALALRRAAAGGDLELAISLEALGELTATLGDYPRAEDLHREALDVLCRLHGDEHPDVAESRSDLAYVLARQGRYEEAETTQRRALDVQRRLGGEAAPALATSLSNLSMILFERGDLPAVEALAREALAIRLEKLGPDAPAVATSRHNLATILMRQGRDAEAEPLLRQVLEVRRKLYGPRNPEVASAMHGLGLIIAKRGDLEEGERLLRAALELRRELLGEDHIEVAKNGSALARVLREQGKLEAAAVLIRDSLEIGRRAIGEHPGQAFALLELGTVLLELGDVRAAAAALREAYELRRRSLPQTSPLTAVAATALGGCLVALGEHREAQGYLLESHRILTGAGENAPPGALPEVLRQLVALYEAQGEPEQAGVYREALEGES